MLKDYGRRVGIQKVDEMIGKREDVGAAIGVITSDSGFTSEAVARAKEDERISLVSVVDVKNERLRARVLVPVLCDFRRPEVQMEFEVTSRRPFQQRELEREALKVFVERWNAGQLDDSLGDHELTETIRDTSDERISVKYIYRVKRRLFFNRIPLEQGAGIYDVTKRIFTTRGFRIGISAE